MAWQNSLWWTTIATEDTEMRFQAFKCTQYRNSTSMLRVLLVRHFTDGYGLGKRNDRGEILVQFASSHTMIFGNTCFQQNLYGDVKVRD